MIKPKYDLNVNIENESEENNINWEDGEPEESECVDKQELFTTKPVLSEHMNLILPSNDNEIKADAPQEIFTTRSILVKYQPIHKTILDSNDESDVLSQQEQRCDDDQECLHEKTKT